MTSTKGRPWTLKRAQRVWEQLRAGTDVKTIAAQQGCTVNNIHKRLRTAGYDPLGAHRAESEAELRLSRIYALRKQGKEFPEIAVELGMEPGPATTRALYMRLVRYCERLEVPYPRVTRPYVPRAPQRYTPDDAALEKLVAVLHRREAEGLDTDVLDLADEAGIDDRMVKLHVAEMRRRHVLADGIVPSEEGLKAADTDVANPICADMVLQCAVAAWRSDGPCAKLDTLVETLDYSRSHINLAIVKLRDEGLFRPRGFLYLRDHA
jgi:hypothetical protein